MLRVVRRLGHRQGVEGSLRTMYELQQLEGSVSALTPKTLLDVFLMANDNAVSHRASYRCAVRGLFFSIGWCTTQAA